MKLSNLKEALSPEIAAWNSDFRRPPFIVCGNALTPAQTEQIRKDYVSSDRYFPIPPDWWHPDGQVFNTENSGEKYPELHEVLPVWLSVARKYPFFEGVVVCLANEELYLEQEWDLMAEIAAQMDPDERIALVRREFEGTPHPERYGWGEYQGNPETYPVVSILQSYAKEPDLFHDTYYDGIFSLSWNIVHDHMDQFHVNNFLYEPQRLRKYIDIGFHIQNGTVAVTQDKEELLVLLSHYLPSNRVLPAPEKYCIEHEHSTMYYCNGCATSVPKNPVSQETGGMCMVSLE